MLSLSLFLTDFFSFHICDQRKEAKERRIIFPVFIVIILGHLQYCGIP
ncbi:hypothetical protein FM120_01045 [Sphingobacterium faecium PCAi_F2.5]|nr:hypothetical protein FM120_01045 [Sphingobacterium faecium PCAi_F2.5]